MAQTRQRFQFQCNVKIKIYLTLVLFGIYFKTLAGFVRISICSLNLPDNWLIVVMPLYGCYQF